MGLMIAGRMVKRMEQENPILEIRDYSELKKILDNLPDETVLSLEVEVELKNE